MLEPMSEPAKEQPVVTTQIAAWETGVPRLYHYEKFNPSFLASTLRDQRIHCSDPTALNDPWDCKPTFDTTCLEDPVEKEKIIDFLQSLKPAKQIADLKDAMMTLRMRNLPSFAGMITDLISGTFFQIAKERWGIYCLTPFPDSTLMWSHYADNHRGICLEFASDFDCIFAWARQVMYRCSYPKFLVHKMDEQALAMLVTKSDHWAYESEFRIIGNAKPEPGETNLAFPLVKDGFLALQPGTLRSVICGCDADYRTIKAIVKEYAPELPVRRALKGYNRYELIIEDEVKPFVPWEPTSLRLR